VSSGAILRLVVQIPNLSGLPWSQKPRQSISPVADASGAKFVSPPLFQSMYSMDSHSAGGIGGPSKSLRTTKPFSAMMSSL